MNAASLFAASERADPDALAIRWDDGAMTYGVLGDQVRRAAAALDAHGVAPGDRVALLLPNHPSFAVALLATLWIGAIAAVLSPAWLPHDLARALDEADARVLVTTGSAAMSLGSAPPITLLVDSAGHASSFDAALDGAPGARWSVPLPRNANDPATILYSSGTTGDPKGVVLTHGNLVFNARSKVRYCEIGAGDALALVVPISHCFGQNVVLLGALAAGATVRMHARFDAGRVLRSIRAGEVSHLFAVPLVFQRLLDAGDPAPLQALRCALSAAAPLSESLAQRWRSVTGHPLRQGYGLTESSPFATYDDGVANGAAGVGRAIAGVEVRIGEIHGDGWAGPGDTGEIAIRGPNVMRGYWRRPAATARALRDGWLRTGDVGRLSSDGALQLVDRLDDVINVAGFKVYPSDVERAVLSHPAIAEAAAYRLPDANRGWLVALDVVLSPGMPLRADEVHQLARERLASFQRPARVRMVSELPRSPSGKVLRRVLTASAAGPEESAPAPRV